MNARRRRGKPGHPREHRFLTKQRERRGKASRMEKAWRKKPASTIEQKISQPPPIDQHSIRLELPAHYTVGVIVSVMNEEQVIEKIIEELNTLPFNELIFVVNGSTDRSYETIRKYPKAVIEHYDAPVGHDVGRALGARISQSDILLFLDGDIPIAAEQLLPFIHAIEQGADIALNDLDPYIDIFSKQDHVTRMKIFLNRLLGRPDLRSNSLTAVPHALSRQALNQISIRNLAVPPVAHAIAIQSGLRVCKAGSVDVIHKNKIRMHNTGHSNPVSNLIIGDHAEALALVMEQNGHRLHYADTIRNRIMAQGG